MEEHFVYLCSFVVNTIHAGLLVSSVMAVTWPADSRLHGRAVYSTRMCELYWGSGDQGHTYPGRL